MADADSIKCCTKCGESKPISEFNLERGKPRAYCKVCHRAAVVAWQKANKDQYVARIRKWRDDKYPDRSRRKPAMPEAERIEKRRAARKKWIAANKEKDRQAKRDWTGRNPHIAAETCRRYQAAKRNAVPAWANKKVMAEFYKEARRLTRETGVVHHVDHVVPLISDVVCGLHCEANLQILTRFDNASKGNKLIEV